MLTQTASATNPEPSDLLEWYDRHRRDLPWRAKPGEGADPYRVWLSEIMLQQTTVVAVKSYYLNFLARFPDVFSLANAPAEAVMQSWAGLGYYSRARNLHACAQTVVRDHEGRFPDNEAGLLGLPGIGAYTAGAISAIAFNQPTAAVDGNVERVISRLFLLAEPLPKIKPQVRNHVLALIPHDRPGDFAQALMDLGATICTPKRPACSLCPWMIPCEARKSGLAETLPVKLPKAARLIRKGAIFAVEREDGAVLLRTRPPTGLLGGMSELPTSEWSETYDAVNAMLDAPLDLRWKKIPGIVRHVFTHFPLELTVFYARTSMATVAPQDTRWAPGHSLAGEALPTVMRKVLAHANIGIGHKGAGKAS